jgi:hypothetical protein
MINQSMFAYAAPAKLHQEVLVRLSQPRLLFEVAQRLLTE